MKMQWLLAVLTVVNLGALVVGTALTRPAAAETVAPVLRARSFQLVDDQGRVRASIEVMPASKQRDGSTYPETVLMRLITERGRPSVKISASEEASGVSLSGPTGTKDTYVILEAKETASTLRLRNEDGR